MDMTATTALRRMGNSTGMIVPSALLAALGATAGERLDIGVENGRLVAARAGELPAGGDVVLTAQEAELLIELTRELNEAAALMESRLDEAIGQLREANDPARDEAIRRRVREEIRLDPSLVDLPGLFG